MPTIAELLSYLANGGALAGSIIVLWLLVTERLVPKPRLEQMVRDRETQIAERKETLAASRQAMLESMSRLDHLREQLQEMNVNLREHTTASKRIEDQLARLEADVETLSRTYRVPGLP